MKQFKEFACMVGCSTNGVPTVSTIKKFADIMSLLDYNVLYMEITETFDIEGEPYFAYNRGKYTIEEIQEIVTYCEALNIEVVPVIQTLGHLPFINRIPKYSAFMDTNDILLVDDDRTYEFIEKMILTMRKMFKTNRINIGMDEAYLLGGGKYQQLHGPTKQIDIFMKHLLKVSEIAKKYNYQCEMWSDVFFHILSKGNIYNINDKQEIPQEWKRLIPDNVNIIYWEYFVSDVKMCEDMIEKHRLIDPNVIYAGTFFRWYGIAPLNAFTNKVMKRALKACANKNVDRVIMTMWADFGGGSSLYATLPCMWYLSRYVKANFDESKIDFNEFEKLFELPYKDFMLLDTPNYPFTDFKTKEVSDYRLTNRSFYYLYDDPFYGITTSLLTDNIDKAFLNTANELRKINAKKYQYLFNTMASLSDALAIKVTLAKRTIAAYQNKELKELDKIANFDYPLLMEKLENFSKDYEIQWFNEYKAFGFEMICLRLGTLKERLKYCKERLNKYLNKEIEQIEELESKHLPFAYSNNQKDDTYNVTRYSLISTHGYIG